MSCLIACVGVVDMHMAVLVMCKRSVLPLDAGCARYKAKGVCSSEENCSEKSFYKESDVLLCAIVLDVCVRRNNMCVG